MITAGIDVGGHSVKAVLLDGDAILATKLVVSEEEAGIAAEHILDALLEEAGVPRDRLAGIAATGWGRREVKCATTKSSEQLCAVRGARRLVPGAGTIVDIGAEGCRAMKLDEDGSVAEFAENSKCASGTGAFIELASTYLKVPLEEFGAISLQAEGRAEISSVCAVFAESAIISQMHRGESVSRIAAGINWATATRVVELMRRVGVKQEVVVVGGAALNKGLIKAIEVNLGLPVIVPTLTQFAVALGAAIQAQAKAGGKRTPGGRDNA